jgi:ankyrin repeat protein
VDVVALLLRFGGSPTAVNADDRTPKDLATAAGLKPIVTMLAADMKLPTLPKLTSGGGSSSAAPPSIEQVLRELHGFSGAAYAEDGGVSVLHDASRQGDDGAVDALCRAGVNVSGRQNGTGNTPLITAATYGATACVSALLAHGAKPNEVNSVGLCALAAACRRCVGVDSTVLLVHRCITH